MPEPTNQAYIVNLQEQLTAAERRSSLLHAQLKAAERRIMLLEEELKQSRFKLEAAQSQLIPLEEELLDMLQIAIARGEVLGMNHEPANRREAELVQRFRERYGFDKPSAAQSTSEGNA